MVIDPQNRHEKCYWRPKSLSRQISAAALVRRQLWQKPNELPGVTH